MACSCIRLCITRVEGGEPTTECIELNAATGGFNGLDYWQFNLFGSTFSLYFDGNWKINQNESLGLPPDSGILLFTSKALGECPENVIFTALGAIYTGANTSDCLAPPVCVDHEDRHKREFKSIKLPKPFIEQNRGWKQDCCVCSPMLTLASLTDSETWKNDVSSAWIKLSDPTDVVSFELYKNNTLTTYTPTLVAFPNESDAFYTTIQWKDVLSSDGIGCFELRVSYNISGVVGGYVWGSYNLREYSIQNALKTARIRVKFNLQQEIEGINFTNANVEDSIRFNGFIGERQPNTEIDNLIYQNREMKTVVRENLNKYTITTDPSEECLITKLSDLYLLSENEMFISDYNAHNHSYKYLDLPVIVEESPEIDYLDILQRKAKLTCVVGDRRKNKRTFY
jgi:hypothetical protein